MRWQYLFVAFNTAGGQWRPFRINDVEIKDWKKGVDRTTFCNQLGMEGWEMVSHTYTIASGFVSTSLIIFKKPL